ncbi:hypothetical protein BGX21_000847 [Mortierella sp. AD011]|nr:hypothetical protein BGX21_000847 [Mortierella sp. AD011]
MRGGGVLEDYFVHGTPRNTIHIIVKRPKGAFSQALKSEERIAGLLEEIEGLRGGKSIFVLDVIVRPNLSEGFSWTTDTETTTIKELERAIYVEYPDREDGDAVLAIYRKTNTKKLVVALETPTKKEGISTEALYSDLHKTSLRRLIDELDSRIRTIPAHTLNEATCSAYVCSFLTQAVLIFNGDLTLAPERSLRGRHGHGKVDYSIESPANDGMRHILGVTEVKQEDFRKGIAQNLVQLGSSLTVRKRKRCNEDDGDRELEDDESVPLKAYNIVTDAVNWYFLECYIDQPRESSSRDPIRPKFRISKMDDIVNYRKSTWRGDATSVLGQIVWLMRKMHSEISKREFRYKQQKDNASAQSTTNKMQRT